MGQKQPATENLGCSSEPRLLARTMPSSRRQPLPNTARAGPQQAKERPSRFRDGPLSQNNRVKLAIHETSGSKLHPKAKRNIVPFGWLASIANNRVKPVLLYLASGPLR